MKIRSGTVEVGAWATTREIADLLGRSDLRWLRERLRLMNIPSRRLGFFGRVEWSTLHVLAVFPVETSVGDGGGRGEMARS